MGASFGIKVDLTALGFDALVKDAEEAVRPAAQAGAQVVYDEVKRNVAKIKRHTGNLANSIYQVYSKTASTSHRPEYHISWNTKKAPHGHLVEFGHLQRFKVIWDKTAGRFVTLRDQPLNPPVRVAARPFIRPAMVVLPQAQQAIENVFFERLQAKGHL